MAALLQKLLDDVKSAMKSGEKEKLETLRTLHSDVKNVGINAGRELTDEVVIEVISKTLKQKNESLEQFKKGGREDLVEAEGRKIGYLMVYMPQAFTPEELEALVKEAIAESGAQEAKDMGKVMKILTPKTKGRADGKEVNQLVQKLLAK